MATSTFIVDCPICKAKVAATETGRAQRSGFDDEAGEPYAERLHVGICPSCSSLIAGQSYQIGFENFDSEYDEWSDITRIFPKPPKAFSSFRIPRVVTNSLLEADRSMQASANIAACVMLGRALEALCRDLLKPSDETADGAEKPKRKRVMLGEGIRELRDRKIIDDRLYEWSQQLQAFRNLAAHPEDISISREDAEDLQTFVHAIVEYVYDLTERYDEFKARVESRAKKKKS